MKSFNIYTIPLTALLLLSACTPRHAPADPSADDSNPAQEMLTITVSIPPQKYFVERIGGDFVRVNVMSPPGADPHSYEPKPEQMRALSNSAAYYTIGVEFEQTWMERIQSANPQMLIVDSTTGIERLPVPTHLNENNSDHTPHPAEETQGLDPHVWTSPRLAKIIAQNIYQSLADLDAAHQPEFQKNLQALNLDIDLLDASIRHTLQGEQNAAFLVFHPSWGYFAQEYGLQQIAVEIGGQEPSPQELAQVIDTAKKQNIHIIFAQPEFSDKTAQTIAHEIQGKVLMISPLAEDWMTNLQAVADAFAEAFAKRQEYNQ